MHLAIAALLLAPSQSVEDLHAAAAFRQAVLAQHLAAIQARLATLPCPPDCGCGCVGGHGCTCTTEFVPVRPVVLPAVPPRVAAPAVPVLPYLPGPRYLPAPPAPIRFAVPAAPVMPRAVYAPAAPPVARSNC